VILPLTLPGIAAGALLVFIPAVGEFVIPDLLGGPGTVMVGKLLWQEFFDNVDWPAAAAIAVVLVLVLTLPLLLAQRFVEGEEPT
jgi:putrescine transport system permease protein